MKQIAIIAVILIFAFAAVILKQLQTETKLKKQIQLLQNQVEQLKAENKKFLDQAAWAKNSGAAQSISDDQLNELLKLRGEVTVLQNEAKNPTAIAAKEWLEKVNKLKQRLEEMPDAKIPEMQFLTEQDWLNVAEKKLVTDADYRRALAELRDAGEKKFGKMFQKAAQKYAQANPGQTLTDFAQLQPYFDSPVYDSILQRWQIEPAKNFGFPSNAGMGDWVITQKNSVDDIFDTRLIFGPQNLATGNFLDEEIGQTLTPVYQAYKAANNGQGFSDFSQLLPYATTPEQQAAFQKQILRASAY